MRLIAANHPFVDGNKRTALMSTRIFYALNGCRFDYDREVKGILKALATDEGAVDDDDVIDICKSIQRRSHRNMRRPSTSGYHVLTAQISYPRNTTRSTTNPTNRTIMTPNPIVRNEYGHRK